MAQSSQRLTHLAGRLVALTMRTQSPRTSDKISDNIGLRTSTLEHTKWESLRLFNCRGRRQWHYDKEWNQQGGDDGHALRKAMDNLVLPRSFKLPGTEASNAVSFALAKVV